MAGSGDSTPVALLLCGGAAITALTVCFVKETSAATLADPTDVGASGGGARQLRHRR